MANLFFVHVWIEHPVRQLDQTFTYLSDTYVYPGVRVFVPFGSKKLVGFVEKVEEVQNEEALQKYPYKLKYVSEVIDEKPLISEELKALATFLKKQTLSTTISCYQAMLPQKIRPQSNHKKIIYEKFVKVSDEEVKLTPKQLEAYMYVQNHQPMTYHALRKQYPNVAKKLIDCGALIMFEEEKKAKPISDQPIQYAKSFTPMQQQAYDEIAYGSDDVYLLKGVTGSGKTEVYLQLAQKVLDEGKQVLILVPEISLTPQMIARVASRFPSSLAIYHSGLNDQEKYEQYQMVKNNEAKIVVGTRSAIFLPFASLGLIVVDEEHDQSYKQDKQPCYHAIDVAKWRGQYHHCKVILGSASPSLDSYARALKNVYHLVEMNERINATKPSIHLVNMKEEMKRNHTFIVSKPLKEMIQERLDNHEQIILLLNRRGYHSQLRCKDCGQVLLCPHCDLSLSYHRDIKRLKCHTCGFEMAVPRICPSCQSTVGFTTLGYGTQKLEEEVQSLFPKANILRMDADTTSRKNAHQKILEQFASKQYDILLGTQMIAKGLDFPNVTLVGILNGDEGLSRYDYRSCELTFDLLLQASGRSGRADKKGDVVIQVFDPTHYAIQAAIDQDYETFFKKEMQFRHAGQYPPYTYMIAITLQDHTQSLADQKALQIKQLLHGNFKVVGVITLLKIQDQYRSRLLLKGKNLNEMITCVQQLLDTQQIDTKGLRIDVNPLVLD